MDPTIHHAHHAPSAALVPVPHGPETGDETADYPPLSHTIPGPSGVAGAAEYTTEQEKAIFAYLTHPDDSFTADGTYWADLPLPQRVKFLASVGGQETAKEARAAWRMFVNDPLSPLGWYFREAVVPGAGLLLEGYVLFSIGNLTPLFAAAWPDCWKNYDVCNETWVQSVTYLEVVGIMVGQIAVGVSIPFRVAITKNMASLTWDPDHRRLDRPPLGPYPGCRHHAHRSAHGQCQLGQRPQRLGHLICLVTLLLW